MFHNLIQMAQTTTLIEMLLSMWQRCSTVASITCSLYCSWQLVTSHTIEIGETSYISLQDNVRHTSLKKYKTKILAVGEVHIWQAQTLGQYDINNNEKFLYAINQLMHFLYLCNTKYTDFMDACITVYARTLGHCHNPPSPTLDSLSCNIPSPSPPDT